MRGNFGLFCSKSPKLPRIQVGLHCNANEENNSEKGYLKDLTLKFIICDYFKEDALASYAQDI